MRHPKRSLAQGVLLAGVVVTACSSSQTDSGAPAPATTASAVVADLRADANRDGEVRFDDDSDADKLTWNEKTGAIFLANIDDDLGKCPKSGNDVKLAACNDAVDDVINGADDVLDLARLATNPWAAAPDDATGVIEIAEGPKDLVRLFKKTGNGDADFTALAEGDAFTADELRAGVKLAIEAKDIVRDKDTWDGFVVVKLTVTTSAGSASDSVKLRVAPVLTMHHLLPAERVFATNLHDQGNAAMRKDLGDACTEAGLPPVVTIDENDQWTQDFFETAYMSMPGPGGAQHVVRVNYRSANVFDPESSTSPLRPAGKVVFSQFRGKDVAAVQQYDIKHDQEMDSLNSFGNLETIPPYTLGDKTYPFGRVLRGSTPTFFPDPKFEKMVESQGMQPPVYIDTSWLLVGHVDETVSFIKAATPRGWALLVNDPTEAKKMLEDAVTAGHGDVVMFEGESWYDDNGKAKPAQATINEVLANTDVMSTSAEAATEIDAQIAVIKKETGLTDQEIVRIPFLHESYMGHSIAYQPGLVNGIYVADGHFVAPKPHGPMIDGVDMFEKVITDRLAPFGVKAHFAEDWDDYHAAEGEVHCGSNVERKIPDAKWWESGR